LLGKAGTAEQKKVSNNRPGYYRLEVTHVLQRRAEVSTKVTKVTKEMIGDRAKDMLYVDLLCTSPESQGHGYGGALLDTITRLVGRHFISTFTSPNLYSIGGRQWAGIMARLQQHIK